MDMPSSFRRNTALQTAGPVPSVPPSAAFHPHAGRDGSIPNSGFPTRPLFYQPRLGFATIDVYGSGKTVRRGGWGMFYWTETGRLQCRPGHLLRGMCADRPDAQHDWQSPDVLASQLNNTAFTAVPSTPTGVSNTDDKEDNTMAYNVTLSQKTPWSGLFELAYIGNVSRDLQSTGASGQQHQSGPAEERCSRRRTPGTAQTQTTTGPISDMAISISR